MPIYPDCPVITRTIEVGGLTNLQLFQSLQQNSILMNKYAERLLSDGKFTTSETKYRLNMVQLTVKDLGYSNGATLPQIYERAIELGLELCPLELGPFLRLAYLDQPEGDTGHNSKHQAPSGSITVASEIVSEDDEFPKGFYLRKINGELWLRGYIADQLHIWKPSDHFIFCQTKEKLGD
jgi:hypothetical protein